MEIETKDRGGLLYIWFLPLIRAMKNKEPGKVVEGGGASSDMLLEEHVFRGKSRQK